MDIQKTTPSRVLLSFVFQLALFGVPFTSCFPMGAIAQDTIAIAGESSGFTEIDPQVTSNKSVSHDGVPGDLRVEVAVKSLPAAYEVRVGRVPLNVRTPIHLVLRNETADDISLTRTQSSCGCLVARFESKEVGVGGGVDFDVVATISSVGEFSKKIVLYGGDEKEKRVELLVIGDAQPLFQLEPSVVELKDKQSTTLTCTLNFPERFTLAGAKIAVNRTPYFNAEITDQSASRLEIEVSPKGIRDADSVSRFGGFIDITLESGRTFEIPIPCVVGSKFSVRPEHFDVMENHEEGFSIKFFVFGPDSMLKLVCAEAVQLDVDSDCALESSSVKEIRRTSSFIIFETKVRFDDRFEQFKPAKLKVFARLPGEEERVCLGSFVVAKRQ